jgi:hypothetical protein
MNASALRVPRIGPELIPLLDTALEAARPHPPRRHSPNELAAMVRDVARAAAEYGPDAAPTRRLLLILGLEHARAEALPVTN